MRRCWRRGYRTTVRCLTSASILLVLGCSKKATPSSSLVLADAGPSAVTAATASSVPGRAPGAPRALCRSLGKGGSFTLGVAAAPAPSGDREGDEEEQDEAFVTSLGSAVSYDGGFLLSAVDYRMTKGFAIVARIEPSVDRGSILELGRVYGDVQPPAIALGPGGTYVALPDSAAGKRRLRLGRFSPNSKTASVEWLWEVTPSGDESPVFSLAASGGKVQLAWDEYDPSLGHQVIRLRNSFDSPSAKPAKGAAPKVMSSATVQERRDAGAAASQSKALQPFENWDVEAPQLVTKPSGFWLGYLAAAVNRGDGKKLAPSAPRPASSTEDESQSVIEVSRRSVQLIPLDEGGSVLGRGVAVTDLSANVVAFDLSPDRDGGAWVAYREAKSTPGVESDEIGLSRLHPDGQISRLRLEDERFGEGTPVLLPSKDPEPGRPHWVFMNSKTGEGLIIPVSRDGKKFGQAVAEPLLGNAEPLLRDGSVLLVARTHGKLVEIERIDCEAVARLPL